MSRAAVCKIVLMTVAALGAARVSEASLITSLPGGTVIAMPAVNLFGGGPDVFSGITWSSTNTSHQGGSVFGFNEGYGFGSNGSWDAAVGNMAGLNDSNAVYGVTDTMSFTFAAPVTGVGGFLNYFPGDSTPTTIAVFDSLGNLIESDNLTFLTGGGADTGLFLGFLESSAIIKSFRLTDNYIGLTNLTVQASSSAVPEPVSLVLLGTGLAAAAAARRRFNRSRT